MDPLPFLPERFAGFKGVVNVRIILLPPYCKGGGGQCQTALHLENLLNPPFLKPIIFYITKGLQWRGGFATKVGMVLSKKRPLFESLALRVFLISFVLVIIPLFLFTLYMSKRIYNERIRDTDDGLTLFLQDQIHYIQQIETNYTSFLEAFYQLDSLIETHYEHVPDELIAPILEKLAKEGAASAIFYLEVASNGDLVCKNSTTTPLYRGVNFTPYFTLNFLETSGRNIFIAKDPAFHHSLYITFLIKDKQGKSVAVLAASIALERLIDSLLTLRTVYEANVSILSKEHIVLASTLQGFKGKEVVFTDKKGAGPNQVYMEKVGQIDEYALFFGEKKRFAVSAVVPQTNAILLLTIPMEVPLQEVYKYLVTIAILLLFMMVIGGGISFLMTIRMAKPLKELQQVMGKVGEGDLTVQFSHDHLGFEINHLGAGFNDMVHSLITHIEEVKKERAEKERYAQELQIGHEIQNSILPSKEIHFPGATIEIFFRSAKEVAGDFYDWMIKGEELFVTIADGVGKGIQGCLYAFDLRSILRTAMSEEGDLQKIVTKTNKLFCMDTKETGSFVTAFSILYNRVSRKLQYVNCGHNSPLLKRKGGKIEVLKLKGIAFGVEEVTEIPLGEVVLEEGDTLVLYTDGINEGENKEKKQYTEQRLETVVRNSIKEKPQELMEEILLDIKQFVGDAEQHDDMTLIIFRAE